MDRNSEFSISNNTPNRVSEFDFPSKASSILKQSVKDELQNRANVGLFSISQLRNKLNERDINYSISDAPYTAQGRSSFLVGSEKIISLTFLPTQFINQFGERDETPRLDLHICACGISVSKTVVKTELINQKGTIKEIVSQPDYNVSIAGVLLGFFNRPTAQNPTASKPIEDMKKLLTIAEAKISVKVTSDTLNMYGITRLSIENLNMPQELADINIQRFSMVAYSDNEDLVIL